MLVHNCRGEAQSLVPTGILSGSIYREAITLWGCEGSLEPSRFGWGCGFSSHPALNKSCDDTELLHYHCLEKVVLDPISSYLPYRSYSKNHLLPSSALQVLLAISTMK